MPRQSQFQYHESGEPLVTWGADGGAELCVPLLGAEVAGVFSGAAAVESGVTELPVTLTWVTGPLSPGLSMRTLTLMFDETGGGVVAAGVVAAGAAGLG